MKKLLICTLNLLCAISFAQIYVKTGGATQVLPTSPTTLTNIGVGTNIPKSKLDVEGNLSIGVNYSGSIAAPLNGAIIEGNVGIGTSSPAEKLEVNGFLRSKKFVAENFGIDNTNYSSAFDWFNKSQLIGLGFKMSANNGIVGASKYMFNFYDLHGTSSVPNGVQIGDDYLAFEIRDRKNTTRFLFDAHKEGGISNGKSSFTIRDKNSAEIFKIIDNGNDFPVLQMGRDNSRVIIGGFSDYVPSLNNKLTVKNGNALVEGILICDTNIGIGTNNFIDGTDTYRLSVNGAVRASRVRVYTTWADFVFNKNYNLPTLEEVESHIINYGHLKDIPSAIEVEENGIELGEMNKKLLQKVEELTLYIIEMNKEIQDLKKQLK